MAVPIKKDVQAILSARANGVDIKTITLPTLGGKGQTLHSSTVQHRFLLSFECMLILSQRLLDGLEAMPPSVVSNSSSAPQSRRTLTLFVMVEPKVLTARTLSFLVSLVRVHLRFSFYSTFSFALYNGYLMSLLEMAAIMGSDVTSNGLKFQFTDRIRPMGKKQQEMRSAGLDPKDIDLDSLYSAKGGGKTGKNISKYFGKDSTKGGIEFQFRAIKQDAKRQKACADAGGDPQTLGIGSGHVKAGGSEIALRMNDGTTAAALQHRFRPIKKEADAMNAAIAGQYGDGVSENGGSAAKKTPNKRTPGGGKRKKAVDGDDDESMAETPSKKAKSARGAVKTPSKRSAKSYTEHDSEVDDEDVNGRVKPEKVEDYGDEDISAPDYSNAPTYATNGNGNGYGYGRGYGHSNGHAVSQDHYTFEDNDNFNSQDNHYGDEDEEV
ncbi:hypothetical protein ONS95_009012 [Cadophora gregata]|uniref:uncharacterized protein n=1 Tax=Cadophora gregata TaxID=51156 RepID=UPI0026DCD208|nr:uncharacterized protein ONS95_009012 [Cadophora gregata]KAK0124026.1 hypothetical protein ONS95_009012 [Cadophora gregata]